MFIFKNHKSDSFFNDYLGGKLDKYQRKVVLDDSDRLLVIAGAGSGKTFTITAKIKYLIEKKNIRDYEILCLSFTNEAVDNIKYRVNYNVDVLTFHKLALRILHDNNFSYTISRDTLINYIVDEYFLIDDEIVQKMIKEYFNNKDNYQSELFVLKNNIISLIKMIKCNNISIYQLERIRYRLTGSKDKILYYFAIAIYEMYEEELASERRIDFDDMIIYAKELVKKHGFKKNYKYIFIDEYQDISKIRFELILEILKYTNAKLICVGDDYQAIYGFSGSNLKIFLDFFKYFPSGKRIDIKNTYRNSYELVNTSVKFIKKNPFQLRKNIHANFLFKYPIVLVYYDDFKTAYKELFDYLYLENEKKVLVLARYNKDLDEVKKEEHTGIDTRYLTVHMAKGLEEESVVLIKFSNDYLGFPSKIENNRLLSLITDSEECVPYAEERRLFYVALTRCKKRIYILVPRDNPSIFLKEIKSSCVELLFK